MSREIALDIWLNKVLGTGDYQRTALAGDASFRKYYRIHLKHHSYIVMDAPPPEGPATFVAIASLLGRHSIQVPEIKAFETVQGFVLLSDFGDKLYLQALTSHTAPALYEQAMDTLLKLQSCVGDIPMFDSHYLGRQWNVFKEWYLQKHLQINLTNSVLKTLSSLSEKLLNVIEEQPIVFVHQDYHSRNLMILEQGGPGVLDFQDAVRGPITYDLVSLLQDAYITWPRSKVEAWVLYYQEKAEALDLLPRISKADFLRWVDLTGLQRHLKNLGVFARLHHRDGKNQYLNDMPRLKYYIQKTFQRYSELHEHATLFDLVLNAREAACLPSF